MSVDLYLPISSQDDNAWGQSFPEPSYGSQTTGDGSDSANSNGDVFATISIPIPSAGWGMHGASPVTDAFAPPPLAPSYLAPNITVSPMMPSPSSAPSYTSHVSSLSPSTQECPSWPSPPSSTTSHSYCPSGPPSDAGCPYPPAAPSSFVHGNNVYNPYPPPSTESHSSQSLPGTSSQVTPSAMPVSPNPPKKKARGANCKPVGPAPLPHGASSYGYPGVRYSHDVQKTCCIIS
ncbi:hypothetical protein BC629DRAFT_543850 [Irpex lacteus]|nr:hypothetical protein BC629DRAFT_543850 [Irpex lacteus]